MDRAGGSGKTPEGRAAAQAPRSTGRPHADLCKPPSLPGRPSPSRLPGPSRLCARSVGKNLTWGTSPCCVFRRPAPHTSSFVAATQRTSEPEGDLLQSIVGRQTLKRELRRWALAAVAAALCPGSRVQDSTTPPPRAALGRHRGAGWRGPWSALSWRGAGVTATAGAWKWLPENTGGAGGSEGTPFSPTLRAQTVISFGRGTSRSGSPRDLLRPRNLPEGLVSTTTMLCGHGPAHMASRHGHASCPSPPGGRQAWHCPGACEFRSAARASLVRGPVATSTAVLTAGDRSAEARPNLPKTGASHPVR